MNKKIGNEKFDKFFENKVRREEKKSKKGSYKNSQY